MMHESGVEGKKEKEKKKKVDWIVLSFERKMTMKALLEIQLCFLSVILCLQGALRAVSLNI